MADSNLNERQFSSLVCHLAFDCQGLTNGHADQVLRTVTSKDRENIRGRGGDEGKEERMENSSSSSFVESYFLRFFHNISFQITADFVLTYW